MLVVGGYPKNYLFCIVTDFLPQFFNIFTQIYLPYLWHFATLVLNNMNVFMLLILAPTSGNTQWGPFFRGVMQWPASMNASGWLWCTWMLQRIKLSLILNVKHLWKPNYNSHHGQVGLVSPTQMSILVRFRSSIDHGRYIFWEYYDQEHSDINLHFSKVIYASLKQVLKKK